MSSSRRHLRSRIAHTKNIIFYQPAYFTYLVPTFQTTRSIPYIAPKPRPRDDRDGVPDKKNNTIDDADIAQITRREDMRSDYDTCSLRSSSLRDRVICTASCASIIGGMVSSSACCLHAGSSAFARKQADRRDITYPNVLRSTSSRSASFLSLQHFSS